MDTPLPKLKRTSPCDTKGNIQYTFVSGCPYSINISVKETTT